jgi:hypothetical protein
MSLFTFILGKMVSSCEFSSFFSLPPPPPPPLPPPPSLSRMPEAPPDLLSFDRLAHRLFPEPLTTTSTAGQQNNANIVPEIKTSSRSVSVHATTQTSADLIPAPKPPPRWRTDPKENDGGGGGQQQRDVHGGDVSNSSGSRGGGFKKKSTFGRPALSGAQDQGPHSSYNPAKQMFGNSIQNRQGGQPNKPGGGGGKWSFSNAREPEDTGGIDPSKVHLVHTSLIFLAESSLQPLFALTFGFYRRHNMSRKNMAGYRIHRAFVLPSYFPLVFYPFPPTPPTSTIAISTVIPPHRHLHRTRRVPSRLPPPNHDGGGGGGGGGERPEGTGEIK